MLRRPLTLALLVSVSTAIFSCDGDEPPAEGAADGSVLLVVPANIDAATVRVTAEASKYLAAQTGVTPLVVRLSDATRDDLDDLARTTGGGLVVVLEADRAAPSLVKKAEIDALPEDGYRVETLELGSHANGLGDTGATVVLAAGRGVLGDEYALYEVVRRLGARFYHPEEEYVPRLPADQIRERARTPTAIARKDATGRPLRDYVPDFDHRTYTFHGAHPLEQLESFSDGRVPIDEARHVEEWMLKNRADMFRGPGRGIAPPDATAQRTAELESLRVELGMRRTTGIELHNQQQGANAQIDPHSPVPVKDQIEAVVDAALADAPDATSFGIHFGPTEFTVTPDEETVEWIDWAGLRARAQRPGIPVYVNDHITGSQPTPHYDDEGCPSGTNAEGRGDYYDLAFHTDPSLGVSVHTVMFYPLEGPARVYDQRSFSHKLCLIQKAAVEGRPVDWFPEGSWWLSFDNTIPVFLPLYISTRKRDVAMLQPLLAARGGGTVHGHRMFDSGHEWGYWQQDYAVGMLHWNTDVTQDEILAEITDSLCPVDAWPEPCRAQIEASGVMSDVMYHQTDFFLDRADILGRPGGLYAYFAGEDPADEIAAASGFEFRPVRVGFRDVLAFDDDLAATFGATDLAALAEAEGVYSGALQRLEAVRSEVPAEGLDVFDELVDGIAIDGLRAQHTRQLYEAVLALRAGDTAAATSARDASAATLVEAEVVIRRREAMYRYPLPQSIGGGVTPNTAVENGTTYPYRVQTKTSLLTYWTYRQDQIDALVAGETGAANRVVVTPVFDDAGVAASFSWPETTDLLIDLALGDGTTVDTPIASHDYGEEEGIYAITGTIVVDGVTIPIAGGVARAARRGVSPLGGLVVVTPESEIAQSTVGSLAPAFRLAVTEDALALAPEAPPDLDDEPLDFATVAVAPIASWDDEGTFTTEATDFVLPVPNGSTGDTLPLRVSGAVFEGMADAEGFVAAPGADAAAVKITGGLVVQDVVDALIQLAGFDQQGAEQLLAGVLDFDPASPPTTVPFVADFQLE